MCCMNLFYLLNGFIWISHNFLNLWWFKIKFCITKMFKPLKHRKVLASGGGAKLLRQSPWDCSGRDCPLHCYWRTATDATPGSPTGQIHKNADTTVGHITYIVLLQTLNHAQSKKRHQWFLLMPWSARAVLEANTPQSTTVVTAFW